MTKPLFERLVRYCISEHGYEISDIISFDINTVYNERTMGPMYLLKIITMDGSPSDLVMSLSAEMWNDIRSINFQLDESDLIGLKRQIRLNNILHELS